MPIVFINQAATMKYADEKINFFGAAEIEKIQQLIPDLGRIASPMNPESDSGLRNTCYPDFIISSPYLACEQTATFIASIVNFPREITYDNRFGDFSDAQLKPRTLFLGGISYTHAGDYYGGAKDNQENLKLPEYYTWKKRFLQGFSYYINNFPLENIWIITHPSVIKLLVSHYQDIIKISAIAPLAMFVYDQYTDQQQFINSPITRSHVPDENLSKFDFQPAKSRRSHRRSRRNY